MPAEPSCCFFRSFTHFLTGVCAIIGGMFTGKRLQGTFGGNGCPRLPCAVDLRMFTYWARGPLLSSILSSIPGLGWGRGMP